MLGFEMVTSELGDKPSPSHHRRTMKLQERPVIALHVVAPR